MRERERERKREMFGVGLEENGREIHAQRKEEGKGIEMGRGERVKKKTGGGDISLEY